MTSVSPERWLSRKETARILGVSLPTLDRMVRDGCPSVTWGRRTRRFRLSDIERWERSR